MERAKCGIVGAIHEYLTVTQLTTIWRRHDFPGHKACRVIRIDSRWQIAGVAVFVCENKPCRLNYEIDCDPHWVTRSAVVTGWVGEQTIDIAILRDANGQWQHNGRVCDAVAGCIDIDLNFSPSTNLLPIRRLNLNVGAAAQVRAAWLKFPSFTLEPLEQSYTRLDQMFYRHESAGGRFVADLSVDSAGMVINYGEIWSREEAAKSQHDKMN